MRFVVGVITCSPGQEVSPLCLIWKTATAPPTAGAGLCSNTGLGITEQINRTAGATAIHSYVLVTWPWAKLVSKDTAVLSGSEAAVALCSPLGVQ